MAMTLEELQNFAEEVVTEVLELVDESEKKNNSFFRRVPRYEINYLIGTIRQLGTATLNLSKTATASERLVAVKDTEIDALNREKLKLILEINHLKAKMTNSTNN